MKNFTETVNGINDKESFLEFMHLLIADLKNNPVDWENRSLESYLEAIAAWTEDMESYYQNIGQPIPDNINWKILADILRAAKMYE